MTNEVGTRRNYLSTRAILFYNINQLIDAFAINNDAARKVTAAARRGETRRGGAAELYLVGCATRPEKKQDLRAAPICVSYLAPIVTFCTDLLPKKATREMCQRNSLSTICRLLRVTARVDAYKTHSRNSGLNGETE